MIHLLFDGFVLNELWRKKKPRHQSIEKTNYDKIRDFTKRRVNIEAMLKKNFNVKRGRLYMTGIIDWLWMILGSINYDFTLLFTKFNLFDKENKHTVLEWLHFNNICSAFFYVLWLSFFQVKFEFQMTQSIFSLAWYENYIT